jgi:transposase
MGKKQYELTESEWLRIKDMLPSEHPKEGKCGRPAKCDNYSAMNELKSEIVSAHTNLQ